MAQHVKNLTSVHEDGGSIPGMAQWFKNLVLLQVILSVTKVAWILRYCG